MHFTLDTNVLIRLFINDVDSEEQIAAARNLVKQARNIYVPQLVQGELVWALKSIYRVTKSQIIMILEELHTHSIFTLQNADVFTEALVLYKTGNADFADYLIMGEAKRMRSSIYTFDKNLVKAGAVLCA